MRGVGWTWALSAWIGPSIAAPAPETARGLSPEQPEVREPAPLAAHTELGPYIAWLCKINDGEYTIIVQIAEIVPGTFVLAPLFDLTGRVRLYTMDATDRLYEFEYPGRRHADTRII